MKYENTKNKLNKIWIKSKSNKEKVNKEKSKIERIENNIIYYTKWATNKITTLSTDWINADRLNHFTNPGHVKRWDIVFEEFPVNLIPFIDCSIFYKKPPLIALEKDYRGSQKYTHIFFKIQDLTKYEDTELFDRIKKVTMIIWFEIFQQDDYSPFNPVSLKLIIKIHNPKDFK